MNHETTIKRIQSLVPSVIDLSFGCEVYCEQALEGEDGNYHDFYGKFVRLLSMYECEVLIFCESDDLEQGMKEMAIPYTVSNLEILGKPITLAVVLRAIEAKMNMKAGNRGGELIELWNLTKDNFDDQSEETKTFIGELLK